MDSRKKSFIKALTWRLLATCTTFLIAFIFTGRINVSLGIAITEAITKIILYYIHERLWSRVTL